MPLSPEQKEAWEKEKLERAQKELTEEEQELRRQRDEARIEKAIKKTARMEKMRKWVFIGVVAVYLLAIILYFLLR
ncbi:MAG: hypothetical protein ACOX0F_11025 [Syntrophomonadaceae bacterium]|jgi:hypothetical protein